MDLFSETARLKILSLFLSGSMGECYVNEAARKAGISQGAASVALRELGTGGFLKSRKSGNALFYSLDVKNPLARRLRADWLLQRLMLDRKAIENPDYQTVALYGSGASGTFGERSDVDVLVITGVPKEKVHGSLAAFGKGAGKEVSLTVLSLAAWQRMAGRGDRFYKEVIANHIVLYGAWLAV
jgi:predicted nucleotidyltransferase